MAIRGALAILTALALAGCGYPEFAFVPAGDTGAVAIDSTTIDSAVADFGPEAEPADGSAIDTSSETAIADAFDADSFIDGSIADTAPDAPDAFDTSVADAKPEIAVDTGPTCTSHLQCPCGEYCSSGKCVPSTDCTKDAHYCPSGVTCKCVAGRWDIDGTGILSGALVPAQPVMVTDNGADLNLRNYSLHDTAAMLFAMRIRPANCTNGWHYRNINIQCVDFAGINASGPRGLSISRRTDPVACRPPFPPELLLDRVNLTTLDSYSVFEDVEYAKVTLRKVITKGSGIVIAAWGPGKIEQLVIEDSPNLYTELQGRVTFASLKASPGFRWWITSPTEIRDVSWPLITITYDKASCPTRTLTNTAQVKEVCTAT